MNIFLSAFISAGNLNFSIKKYLHVLKVLKVSHYTTYPNFDITLPFLPILCYFFQKTVFLMILKCHAIFDCVPMHCLVLQCIVLCCVAHHTTHHTTPCHTTPCHTTPCHTTPHHTTPHQHTTPHHTTPHHTTPHHTTCHITPHHMPHATHICFSFM